jgi:DNA-directed RNA polymerase subunit M/transcription elongation factor TFIIS
MDSIDPVEEWRRLKELYAHLTDEELQAAADEGYELTEVAKQVLQAEVLGRGLNIQLRDAPPPELDHGTTDFDPADLDLVVAQRVWDITEARQVKAILDDVGIPSYLGPDNLEDVEAFKSTFENGVDLKVRNVDNQFALRSLARSLPETPDASEYIPVCPKCHSAEIVFQSLDAALNPSSAFDAKFNWTCDACGYQWRDDGIETEA